MNNEKIKRYMPLVRLIAQQYLGCGVEMDDMMQEGCLGLMEADRRFDAGMGVTFESYASTWIRRAILRALDTYGHPVKLPQHAEETEPILAQGLRVSLQVAMKMEDSDQDIEAMMEEQEEQEEMEMKVERLLGTLTQKQRQVIVLLHGWKGGKVHEAAEVAEIMQIKVSTVHLIRHRALAKMRKAWTRAEMRKVR